MKNTLTEIKIDNRNPEATMYGLNITLYYCTFPNLLHLKF